MNAEDGAVKRYCYVIVENSEEDFAAYIVGSGDAELDADAYNEDSNALALLLQDGWKPVRETPMGGAEKGMLCSLVLLEKD